MVTPLLLEVGFCIVEVKKMNTLNSKTMMFNVLKFKNK